VAALPSSDRMPNSIGKSIWSIGCITSDRPAKTSAITTTTDEVSPTTAYDVYASVQGRDLGGASIEICKTVAVLQVELKPGNSIEVLGQIQSMYDSFRDPGIGLLFAAVFVSLLMVVNYQTSVIH
jgi:multidrug efflux pump subunit AcrB